MDKFANFGSWGFSMSSQFGGDLMVYDNYHGEINRLLTRLNMGSVFFFNMIWLCQFARSMIYKLGDNLHPARNYGLKRL